MSAHWRLLPFEPADIRRLSAEAKVAPLVAHLLWNRGLRDAEACRNFIECRQKQLHDPERLPGAPEAARRLANAVRDGRKIVVYGDYDVDGVCGTTLLWDCLRLAGARALDYYIPHRVDEGYGLNSEALRTLRRDHQADVVVTVDCGITAVAEARLARELGIELIITDHHTFHPDQLPPADVLVHPRLPGGAYPYPEICGAGVAFKVAWQLAKSFGDGKKASPHLREFLVRALNLVALATVADVVPLEDENRIFVRHGLQGLGRDPSVGLQALLQVSGCVGKPRLNSGHLGFNLGPRINAAGRMQKARDAVELLTTADASRAAELAAHLDACNHDRQELERSIYSEAMRRIDEARGPDGQKPSGIVVAQAGWHPGVIGIVAGRVAESHHRPTIVLAIDGDLAQGSGRSVTGFDLHAALTACRDGLITFGGHKAAAGLKLPASLVPEFTSRFDAFCAATLTPDQMRREIVLDAEVRLGELTYEVVSAVESLEPYGVANPKPLLLVENVRLLGPPRIVGQRKNHLSFRVEQGGVNRKAIAWNLASRADELAPGAPCSVVFTPTLNEWNGRTEVQLEVKDFAAGDPAMSVSAGSRPTASLA
jgi:single-stranded-DNA-specific exonuclease